MFRFAILITLIMPLQAAWLTDLEAGKKKAAEEEKDLYLVFTSLKVSGACVQLEKRILSRDSFQEEVAGKFVLVHLDVPLEQTPGMVDPLMLNGLTARKYGVESYPTAIYLDSKARPYLVEMGALKGGPEEYAAHLLKQGDKQALLNQSLQEAYRKDGLERARAIITVIESAPPSASPQLFETEMKDLALLDPEDSLGFQKKRLSETAFEELESALRDVFHKDSYDEVVKLVDLYVTRHQPEGALLQKALFRKLAALQHGKKIPESRATADAIIAAGPDSAHGRFAKQIRDSLK